jgi:hypothetical protein
MRRTRKAWVIGAVAAVALLAALAAVGAVASRTGFDLWADGETAGSSSGGDIAVGVPDTGSYPGLDWQKAAYSGETLVEGVRTDGGESGAEPGVATAPTTLTVAADGRRLVRTADLGLVIGGHDVTSAADRVTTITETLGGYVLFSYTGTPDDPVVAYPEDGGDVVRQDDPALSARHDVATATVTVRVPERFFETALRRFAKLGEVEYRQTSTEDVSDQMVDLEARLRHARAVEARLLRFLQASDTIREMLAVQDRLDQVQLEIEQLAAQIASLREIVSYSTISVSMRAEGDPRPVIGAGGGVWDNFVDAWRLVGRSARVLLMALAAALPFVIVLGTIVGAGWYAGRRLARRRSRGTTVEGTA